MIIQNETRNTVSWTCYDVNDTKKSNVLGTGKLLISEVKNFTPPQNKTSKFYVVFTTEATNSPIASGTCGPDQAIGLSEVEGSFCTKVVMAEALSPVV